MICVKGGRPATVVGKKNWRITLTHSRQTLGPAGMKRFYVLKINIDVKFRYARENICEHLIQRNDDLKQIQRN